MLTSRNFDEFNQLLTLVDILCWRAERQREEILYRFLPTGEVAGGVDAWSYGRVDQAARRVAVALEAHGAPGDRVLLLFPGELDFVAALMGCFYAGRVAVPTYPPDPGRLERTLPRLKGIAADCEAQVVLTTSTVRAMAEVLLPMAPELAAMRWIAVDALPESSATEWRRGEIDPETIALLQYTSGSTGMPKGVMLGHAQLMANERLITYGFGHAAGAVGVGWLPLFHDMGLIGNVLQPLYHGFPCTLMSPLAFLQRPLRWLQAISHFGATTSGGPNFAYELCVRKVPDDALPQLDLHTWKVAFNGAEPIQPGTLDRFCEKFARCGFRREALYPCYGLAEATLIVTGSRLGEGAERATFDKAALARNQAVLCEAERAAETRVLVSSGVALPDHEVVIVDPDARQALPGGQIGEIWVRGPSCARGYWGRPEETQTTFAAVRADGGAGGYLRTGDLGFALHDALFVTGRIKDLIIVRGQNHAPQDIERTAAACDPALRPGCGVAFEAHTDGEERVVLVHEVDPGKLTDAAALAGKIRQAVAEEHGIHLETVVLLGPGTVPKTSSGKLQRQACKAGYLAGTLPVLTRDTAAEQSHGAASPAAPLSARAAWLVERAAAALRVPVARVEQARAQPLIRLGLDSLASVELQAAISDTWGVTIPAATLLGGASCNDLLAALDAAAAPAAVAPPSRRSEGDFPLSYPQQEIWLAQRQSSDRDLGRFHVRAALRLAGALRVDGLVAALTAVVRRQQALRTCFPEREGQAVQRILAPAPDPVRLPVPVEDLGELQPEDREARMQATARREAVEPFDLDHGPLFRVRLLRLDATQHVLLFTVHHLVADGWSMRVLIDEIATVYGAQSRGEQPVLPALPMEYSDFTRWQRDWLSGERLEQLLSFWKTELASLPSALRLPVRERSPVEAAAEAVVPAGGTAPNEHGGATLRQVLPAELATALNAACAAAGVTPFVWLFAVYATLLFRLTGQDDVPIGVAVLGRDRPELQRLIGNFVHMVVLRARLHGDPRFAELVEQVRDTAQRAWQHQELPLDVVVSRGFPERVRQRMPLFRTAFGTQNQPRAPIALPGLAVEVLPLDEEAARLDLTLWVSETPEGLQAVWTYATSLFDAEHMARLHARFTQLLKHTLAQPQDRLAMFVFDAPAVGGTALHEALGQLGGRARRAGVVAKRPREGDPT